MISSAPTRNAGFAVKLDDEVPFHLFCDWDVPAEYFDTASSLPYPEPFALRTSAIRMENLGGRFPSPNGSSRSSCS